MVVSTSLVSPVLVENIDLGNQHVLVANQWDSKSPRIKGMDLEMFGSSLKKVTLSEIKTLINESQEEP